MRYYLRSSLLPMIMNARTVLLYATVFSIVLNGTVLCKRFETRCKLVRELLKVGVHNDVFLGQWVCLIEKVSNRNTEAYTVSPGGRKHYGLYQIPSRWCREGKRGGQCNLTCESLLDDDIMEDTRCALYIFQEEGFKFWPQWNRRCKNDNHITNEIYRSCPELFSPRSSPQRNLGSRLRRRQIRNAIKIHSSYEYNYFRTFLVT